MASLSDVGVQWIPFWCTNWKWIVSCSVVRSIELAVWTSFCECSPHVNKLLLFSYLLLGLPPPFQPKFCMCLHIHIHATCSPHFILLIRPPKHNSVKKNNTVYEAPHYTPFSNITFRYTFTDLCYFYVGNGKDSELLAASSFWTESVFNFFENEIVFPTAVPKYFKLSGWRWFLLIYWILYAAVSYEHFNPAAGSAKGSEFTDQLGDCSLLKTRPVPWMWLVR